MSESKHHELIEKFYEGNTSEQEEKKLAELLILGEINDPYLESMLELQIEDNIQNVEIQFLENSNGSGKTPIFYLSIGAIAAAAVIALIMLIIPTNSDYSMNSMAKIEINVKTIDDLSESEKIAYSEAKEALLLLSKKLNSANDQMKKISMINSKSPIKM